MDRILDYISDSQKSWGSQITLSHDLQVGQGESGEGTTSPEVHESIPQEIENEIEFSDYRLLDELFMTPESDEDTSDDGSDTSSDDGSDTSSDDDLDSPVAPNYSPLTPPMTTESDRLDAEIMSQSQSPLISQQSSPLSWNWIKDTTLAQEQPFNFSAESGFTEIPTGEDVELRFFLEFLTGEILDLIVEQSNIYEKDIVAAKTAAKKKLSRRNNSFKEITREDILRMIAVKICMGLDHKPTQAHYWSGNPFYKSEIVPVIMTSDRYKDVMQYLHFCNNKNLREGDRLFKIRDIWHLFNERLGLHCTPGKNICIDESLVSFKGNLSIRQYIPSKAAKIGIKLFSIGDSESGYMLNTMIYEGKEHSFKYDVKTLGFGGAVAMELSERYLNFGRCLYVDNYFVNVRMAKELLNCRTNICGTVRKRLKFNPPLAGKMNTGATEVYSCAGIMIQRWKDKRDVCILSTGHEHSMATVRSRGGRLKLKPTTVLDYNLNSRAIDKMDMVTGTYDMNRKSSKWYKKVFFKMIEICLYNANILYGKMLGKISIMEFKERVVLQILKKYGEHATKRGRPSQLVQKRYVERHFMDYIPASETNEKPSRDCVYCRSKRLRKQTRFHCPNCKVALCVVPCFKLYHTKS